MMHRHGWDLVREIGVDREGASAEPALLPSPIAIERLGGERREFLVLDRRGNRGSIFVLEGSALRPLPLQGLHCGSGMLKAICGLEGGARGFLLVAGDQPREISRVDAAGRVREIYWSSQRPGPLSWPSCAIPFQGQILVGDQARHHGARLAPAGLCLLSSGGDCRWQWRPGKGRHGLGEPTHLLALPGEDIIVTDAELHRVVCVTVPGRIRWIYGEAGRPGAEPGHLSCPTSTTLTPRGTLLVADTRNHRLVELSLEGKFLRLLAVQQDPYGARSGGLNCPSQAVELESGEVYIADTGGSRIAQWRGGGLRTVAGRENPKRQVLSFPRSVQTLSRDRWLVADTNNNRVVEIDGRGKVHWQYGNGWPAGGARLRWPRCARKVARSIVAIADGLNGRLLLVNRQGTTRAEISSIRLAGQELALQDPHDVALTGRGTLLVADPLLALVAEIDLRGTALWWFGSPGDGGPLRDPHQVAEIGPFRVRIVDPSVGLATVDIRTGRYDVATAVSSRAGELLALHQPKAALETPRFLVIADHDAARFSLVFADARQGGYGIDRLRPRSGCAADPEAHALNNPRWIDSLPGGDLILSDFEAHRLVHIAPSAAPPA